jgi:acetyl-CoA carboxylase carboxyltransferase component
MEKEIQRLETLRSKILRGGRHKHSKTRAEEGKSSARHRVKTLLDPGTFFEIDMFSKPISTGFPADKKSMHGDGLIAGYGEINGRPVCLWAQDRSVFGGRAGIVHGQKIVSVMERAIRIRVPCIALIDSEGIREQEMLGTPTDYTYDRLIFLQSQASGVIPQISLIMGPCLGPAAVSTQLSDFVFMVKGKSYTCISSWNSEMELEKMGGTETHFNQSGCCDFIADRDKDCIKEIKQLLAFLPLSNEDEPPWVETGDDPNRKVPELLSLVPQDSKKPYDIHDVIKAIVDNGEFFETKRGWARNLVTGFARFGGKPAGVIANNPMVLGGCLDVNSADKLSRFVRFCDAFNMALVYLADTPAFLPSIEQERKGIIRHGAKAVFSNSVASTVQIQIYLRKCYGGGNLAMPGSNLGGDIGLAWPTSELLLMKPEGAVGIIYRKEIQSAEDPKEEFRKRLANFKDAGAVENLWEAVSVQDYIDPQDTRAKIVRALQILSRKREIYYKGKHDNMPL